MTERDKRNPADRKSVQLDFSRLQGGIWGVHPPEYKEFLWYLKRAMIRARGDREAAGKLSDFIDQHSDIDSFLSAEVPDHDGKNTYDLLVADIENDRRYPNQVKSPIVPAEEAA